MSLSALQAFSDALSAIVAEAAPGLVAVHSRRSRATGIVWRPGLIVTPDEALAEHGGIAVTLPGGDTVPATLAGRDSSTDVALLRVDHPSLRPAALVAGNVAAGALAMAVAVQDGDPTAALGVVSRAGGAWRSLRGGAIDQRIELDLSLRRASEGGLVIDAAGRAIGMAVFGPRRRVLVIPSATIDRVAARLDSHGRIARGYLGIGLQPVRLDDGGIGVMVMSVDAKGPAAAAGVHQGDVIVAWNGQKLRGVQSLLGELGPDNVGVVVTLSLQRAGQATEVKLTIGERLKA